MYASFPQLDHQLYQQVESLCKQCREQDGGTPLLYPNLLMQRRNSESNWLMIEHEQCVGMASVYYFYDEACEITLMVAPDHRKQGIATQLLKLLMPQLWQHGMKRLIFTVGTDSPYKSWLQEKGLTYLTSEYHMQREGYDPKLMGERELQVRPARRRDIEVLCQIDDQCFSHRPEMAERFASLINDAQYTLLVAEYNHKIIGKAHIHWQNNEAVLSDIAILPLYQGQGLGGELLASAIGKALKEGFNRQTLDVETTNAHALQLYKRYGFKTFDAHDYWQLSLTELEHWLRQHYA